MLKKISLALFTLRYASVSLVVFGIKINHHAIQPHDDQGKSHAVAISEGVSCGEESNACISCGDEGGIGCCNNEATCFTKCSKGTGLFAYINPKDDDSQFINDLDTSITPPFDGRYIASDYKIIWNKARSVNYQISQTPHYRVGIIQLVI